MYGATLLQAARGPILLITLGALFLLHQNTEHNFNRTFPVLLIVFGIMKLLEFFAAKNEEPSPGPAYGVGGPIVNPPFQPQHPVYTPPQPYSAPASPSERGVYTPPAPKAADPANAEPEPPKIPDKTIDEEGGIR